MLLVENFISLFMESAPWLMLGLLVAGLMKAFVPTQLLASHLGGNGIGSTIKAALLGAPLPLCSCGVIPAALGLRRSGASKSATVSFLISTPETGVDSISISYALLGPYMAIARPVAAVVSAITAGFLVGKDPSSKGGEIPVEPPSVSSNNTSCCAKKTEVETAASSCCASKAETQKQLTIGEKLSEGVRFTFVDLIDDIAKWLLIGLLMAAVIKTWVPNEFLAQWGDGFIAFVVMAAIGVPMYICATASTPIAAGLLFSGVSPGAVLVFLLVGPATNIATMGMVKQELGTRALVAYLGGVVIVAFIAGYLTNTLAHHFGLDFGGQAQHAQALVGESITIATSLLLAVLMLNALWPDTLLLSRGNSKS